MTDVEADALPVCILTLTRSRGWPTSTQQAPPTPPDKKDLSADSGFGALVSISPEPEATGTTGLDSVSIFIVEVGALTSDDAVDMVDCYLRTRRLRRQLCSCR
mmetsp:Transcript_13266/g.30492  ORF Transcript_13266/g.30492 Transcript_13266/m.30492 type:complete len:103 (+) Transcript_13266:3-311(+)